MKRILVPALLALSVSTAGAEIYTWKDAKGTVHYTNSLHEIPTRYLKRAKVLDVATGKKTGPALASPGVAAPAPASAPPSPAPAPIAAPAPAPMPAPPAAASSAPSPAPAPSVAPTTTEPTSAVNTPSTRPAREGQRRATRRYRGSEE